MDNNGNLTLQELEQLSQAYMDCRLSRLQEKEFELVLLSTEVTSPIIDAARDIMGLTSLMTPDPAVKKGRRIKRRTWFLKFAGVAAAIAVIVVCGVTFFKGPQNTADDTEIFVCVDGKVMSPNVAQSIAAETEEKSMEMLRSVVENAENVQRLSTQYMNSLIK